MSDKMNLYNALIAAKLNGGGGGGGFTPTTAQLAAMNSGVTAEDVTQIGTNTSNISKLKFESKTITLNGDGAIVWTTSGQGQYYSAEINLSEINTVLGWCIAGFNALDGTAWFLISQATTSSAMGKFRLLSNKNSFPTGASISIRIFGTTDTVQ